MPTYEYQCSRCGLYFERQQSIHDAPVSFCPECRGDVRRQISGGSGFMMTSTGMDQRDHARRCLHEETGKTCCGADNKCGQSHCGN
mgnify:CR=1 FL=1